MDIEVNSLAWLKLSDLSDDNVTWLKTQLTITQRVSPEYAKRSKPATVELFKIDEQAGRIGIPREFFFESLTKDHNITYTASKGEPWPGRPDVEGAPWAEHVNQADKDALTFFDIEKKQPAALSDQQKDAVFAAMTHLAKRPAGGALLEMGTGTGKTILSLYLASQLKMKTAILVHRAFLMDQWKKRILRFYPEAKIGTISGKTYDVEGCHFVLCMIETMASWVKKDKCPDGFSDMFGLVIADECDRVGAPQWGQAIPLFNSAYRIGVSARTKRSDGLDKVFYYHIGKKVFTGTTLNMIPKVRRVFTNYKFNHPRLNPAMLSMEYAFKFMSKDPVYNQDIVTQLMLALDKGRKILVFSHTVKHLETLKAELDNQYKNRTIKTDFYIGGMTQDDLDIAAEADCIFGTFKMCNEGLDIPALDTVVLAGPIRNPQQSVGRCIRDYPDKKDPVVVDFRADNVPVFKDYGESRDKAYQRLYGDSYIQTKMADQWRK